MTDRTAGALKAYRLLRTLAADGEREAYEIGVAVQVMESRDNQMAGVPFIDTYLLLRHFRQDQPS